MSHRPVCPTRSTLAPGPLARRMFWDQLEHLSESDPRGECRDGTRYLKHKAFCGLSDFVTSEMHMFRFCLRRGGAAVCGAPGTSPVGALSRCRGASGCALSTHETWLGWAGFHFPFLECLSLFLPLVLAPDALSGLAVYPPTAFLKNSLLPLCLSAP